MLILKLLKIINVNLYKLLNEIILLFKSFHNNIGIYIFYSYFWNIQFTLYWFILHPCIYLIITN